MALERCHDLLRVLCSYVAIDPGVFKLGDVVEVAFCVVGIPVKDKKYRMLLSLRALTLVSDACRKVCTVIYCE